MKVAIIIDQMIERNWTHRILDQLCLLYPDHDIFTLAHVPNKIDGVSINSRVISTPLSRWVKNEKSLNYFALTYPGYIKSWSAYLTNHPLRIVITNGRIGLIPKARGVFGPKTYYILSNDKHTISDKKRILKSLLTFKFHKGIHNSDGVIIPFKSYQIDQSFSDKKKTYILPPFKSSNYRPILKDSSKNTDEMVHLLYTKGLSFNQQKLIKSVFEQLNIVVESIDKVDCLGKLSERFKSVKSLINIGEDDSLINDIGMLALSCGIPQIYRIGSKNIEGFLEKDKVGLALEKIDPRMFKDLLLQMENEWSWFNPEEMHQLALRFDSVRYNPQIKRFINYEITS